MFYIRSLKKLSYQERVGTQYCIFHKGVVDLIINDRQITISAAGSRKAIFWPAQTLYWSELLERLKTPVRSTETLAEYLRYPKSKQDELKDVGGFVAGILKDNRRKASNVLTRDVITLDLDNILPGGTQDILRRIEGLGCAYAVYSTRKHEEAKEISEAEQEAHSESSAKEGIILEFVSRRVPIEWEKRSINERKLYWAAEFGLGTSETMERDRICAAELWCECFGGDLKFMRRSDSLEINNILASMAGWKRHNSTCRYGPYGTQKGFIKL